MDAGACVSCQHTLGEYDTEQTIGYFPRLRCVQCGWVNVLTSEGLAVFAPQAESWSQPEEEPAAPIFEASAVEESEDVELAVSESVPFAMVAYQAETASWDDAEGEAFAGDIEDSASTGYYQARKGGEEFLEESPVQEDAQEVEVDAGFEAEAAIEENEFDAVAAWETSTADAPLETPEEEVSAAPIVEKNEEMQEYGLAEPRLTMMQELSDDDLAEIAALSAAAGFGAAAEPPPIPVSEEVAAEAEDFQDAFTSMEEPMEDLDSLAFDDGSEATRVGIDLAEMEEEQKRNNS